MSANQEDTMYRIYNEIKLKRLRRKFDKQLKKMKTQEKHKYKEVCELWEYALKRIQE